MITSRKAVWTASYGWIGTCASSAHEHMHRFDTATPAVNPVLMRRVELPGGWNLDDYNTTQARFLAFYHA